MVLSNLRFLVTHLNYGLIGLEPNYTHSKHTDSNFDDRDTNVELSNDSPSVFPSFQLFVNLESRVYTMGEDNWLSCNLV